MESASVIPSKLTNALIALTFGSSYGLIKNRGFAKLQFQSLHMRPDLFEEYYRDTCQITKSDMISFLKANTAYAPKRTLQNCQASTWTLTGDSYVTECNGSAANVISNGYTLYVNGVALTGTK